MKKEAPAKTKKWLWIAIAAIVLMAAASVVLIFTLGNNDSTEPTGEQDSAA